MLGATDSRSAEIAPFGRISLAGRGVGGKDFITGGHVQKGKTAKADLQERVGNRFEIDCEEIYVLIPPVV
ncbi:MAG: hypothetical protein IT432_06835 [Phycisphaerales bacterium]|nr:hypothetical protein [Phycisphaerales bacterium]